MVADEYVPAVFSDGQAPEDARWNRAGNHNADSSTRKNSKTEEYIRYKKSHLSGGYKKGSASGNQHSGRTLTRFILCLPFADKVLQR